ncbi:hypothetical protein BDY19DRAFT_889007 [Irpex rosettiformis]|uniref:Uncharacterized protein n=1 Tax=Irpex rosettiformis TaxID=378272 RepID=A0ACB8U691_9APHY|nr:hypothetical protein BDY19DRAFT_889007 [Irpex rosettiformis]
MPSTPSPPLAQSHPTSPHSPLKELTGSSVLLVRPGTEVTNDELAKCARLFSDNYGVWGPKVNKPLYPGGRVKMNAARLRKQCLSDPENTILSMRFINGELVGHAFATQWKYGEHVVCWVTQLVVDINMRQRYIATSLLQHISMHAWFISATIIGLVSSHPAACHAVAKLAGTAISRINLEFIQAHAEGILNSTTVDYLKGIKLKGSLFDPTVDDGTVSLVDTSFFVDHDEPQATLDTYIQDRCWVLGNLVDGHEFFMVVPVIRLEVAQSHPSDPFV